MLPFELVRKILVEDLINVGEVFDPIKWAADKGCLPCIYEFCEATGPLLAAARRSSPRLMRVSRLWNHIIGESLYSSISLGTDDEATETILAAFRNTGRLPKVKRLVITARYAHLPSLMLAIKDMALLRLVVARFSDEDGHRPLLDALADHKESIQYLHVDSGSPETLFVGYKSVASTLRTIELCLGPLLDGAKSNQFLDLSFPSLEVMKIPYSTLPSFMRSWRLPLLYSLILCSSGYFHPGAIGWLETFGAQITCLSLEGWSRPSIDQILSCIQSTRCLSRVERVQMLLEGPVADFIPMIASSAKIRHIYLRPAYQKPLRRTGQEAIIGMRKAGQLPALEKVSLVLTEEAASHFSNQETIHWCREEFGRLGVSLIW